MLCSGQASRIVFIVLFSLCILIVVVAFSSCLVIALQKTMKVLVVIKVQAYFITLFVFCSRLNVNRSFVDEEVTLIPR